MSEANAVVPPAAPAAAPAAPPAADPNAEPAWLKPRLERERESAQRQILAELGVTDAKDAKASIESLKKLQDAQKTEEQRLRDANARIPTLESENAALKAAVSATAAETMGALTDIQKSAVLAIAGEDPAKQIATVASMRKAGMLTAPAVSVPAAPAAVPPPASTSAAPAPPPSGGISPPNHLLTWQEMRKTNPFLAAQYRIRHSAEIEKAQKT